MKKSWKKKKKKAHTKTAPVYAVKKASLGVRSPWPCTYTNASGTARSKIASALVLGIAQIF